MFKLTVLCLVCRNGVLVRYGPSTIDAWSCSTAVLGGVNRDVDGATAAFPRLLACVLVLAAGVIVNVLVNSILLLYCYSVASVWHGVSIFHMSFARRVVSSADTLNAEVH